ncbi:MULTISPECIES: hypothetical protein [unclassified Variovorax]|uniref:hypothetical protein n=1 Tax=unclassified Variovorax TaxID=663243 RepID=UPI00116094D3|nr:MULTISPECIES: hypothetical protein [unclassified Variovorax]
MGTYPFQSVRLLQEWREIEVKARSLEKTVGEKTLVHLRGDGAPTTKEERAAMHTLRALADRRFAEALRQVEKEDCVRWGKPDPDQPQ